MDIARGAMVVSDRVVLRCVTFAKTDGVPWGCSGGGIRRLLCVVLRRGEARSEQSRPGWEDSAYHG